MTRNSIRELVEAVRERYRLATKTQKGAILDEFCQTTKYHRKAAVRLLCHPAKYSTMRRGRPREYGPADVQALKTLWEVAGQICSKRLAPFVPTLMERLEAHGELSLPDDVRFRLARIRPATVDRLLKPFRAPAGRRPYSQARSSSTLKAQIPIRTFAD